MAIKRKYNTIDGDTTSWVPCGKCPACLQARRSAWVFRLLQEQKVSDTSVFTTLTYDDDHIKKSFNGHLTVDKRDHQLFMKKLRKELNATFPHSPPRLSYYAVGEYGGETHRPHCHQILFNLPKSYINTPDLLRNIWSNGNIQIDECNIKTISYVTGYVHKQFVRDNVNQDETDDREKEFSLMSKGMGLSYLTPQMKNFYKTTKTPYIIKFGGQKQTMPRYYKHKIGFSKEEKNQMAEISQLYADSNYQFKNVHHEYDFIEEKYLQQERSEKLKRTGI